MIDCGNALVAPEIRTDPFLAISSVHSLLHEKPP
jgi:hypothetical protein